MSVVNGDDLPHDRAMARFLAGREEAVRQLENDERGAYAEALTATVLADAGMLVTMRPGWANYDLAADGIKIEVKTSGIHQAWHATTPPKKRARPTWEVKDAFGWDPDTDTFAAVRSRSADVYVFWLHEGTTLESGWRAFVAPRSAIDTLSQKTAGLATVLRIGAEVDVDELATAITAASGRPRL